MLFKINDVNFMPQNSQLIFRSPHSAPPYLRRSAVKRAVKWTRSCSLIYLYDHDRDLWWGVSWAGVRLGPLGTSVTNWSIASALDDDECGTVGGMRIGRGNQNTSKKPASVPLCPPQIPHDLSLAGRCSGKPATNRLRYGVVITAIL
jgi:hypothetical protein